MIRPMDAKEKEAWSAVMPARPGAWVLAGLIFILLPSIVSSILESFKWRQQTGHAQPVVLLSRLFEIDPGDPKMQLAFIVALSVLGVAVLLTVVSLPVYYFAKNKERSRRAGRIAQLCLGFILSAGTAAFSYIGFKINWRYK